MRKKAVLRNSLLLFGNDRHIPSQQRFLLLCKLFRMEGLISLGHADGFQIPISPEDRCL